MDFQGFPNGFPGHVMEDGKRREPTGRERAERIPTRRGVNPTANTGMV